MGYITLGSLHCNIKCKERFWITLLLQISCHRLIMKLYKWQLTICRNVYFTFFPTEKQITIYTFTVDNPKVISLLSAKWQKKKKL